MIIGIFLFLKLQRTRDTAAQDASARLFTTKNPMNNLVRKSLSSPMDKEKGMESKSVAVYVLSHKP